MRYLGLDQSLTGTGLCLLEADGTVVVLETINPGKRRGAERLAFIRDTVSSYLQQERLVAAAFEGYSYGSTGKVFELGEIGGVLQVLLYDRSIPFSVVPPASLKKYATGNAHALKDVVIRAAQTTGARPTDDNQADAFFLASIAKDLDSNTYPAGRARIEVIHQMRNPKVKTTRRIRRLVKHAI